MGIEAERRDAQSDHCVNAAVVVSVDLVVIPLGVIAGCCAGMAARAERAAVARNANNRMVLTAQAARPDDLHWSAFQHIVVFDSPASAR